MAQPRLPKIRGTQIGLRDPGQVDQIKADMLAERFAFDQVHSQIAGVRDPSSSRHGNLSWKRRR